MNPTAPRPRIERIAMVVFIGCASLAASLPPKNSLDAPIYLTGRTIPYYSKGGRAYALRHRVSAPPFRRGQTAKLDPPRDVPAEDWDGAFCATWTDECTTCDRDETSGSKSCKPADLDSRTAPEHQAAGCMRRPVKCTSTLSRERFLAVCRHTEFRFVRRMKGGSDEVFFSTESQGDWFLSRRDKRWHLFVRDGGDFPPPRPAPKPEYFGQDTHCMQAVGDPKASTYGADTPAIER